jgi:hypothetical protein
MLNFILFLFEFFTEEQPGDLKRRFMRFFRAIGFAGLLFVAFHIMMRIM